MIRRYRLHSIERDGTEWTSSVAFDGDDRDVRRAVIAGYLAGSHRWATEEHTGRFLCGLDPTGRETSDSSLSLSPMFLADTSAGIYAPAVRIYEPDPRLRLEPIRGYAHVRLVFDGVRCVGWTDAIAPSVEA